MVKVFSLQHTNAEEMQRIVSDLFGSRDSRQAAFARARSPRTVIRTSSDPRTNSLIVVGPQSDLAVIEALVERLDTPAPQGRDNEPERKTISQLRQRVARLEQLVAELRAGTNRARSPQAVRDRSSSAPSRRPQTGPVAEVAGTRIRIEASSPKEAPMKVASVVTAGKRVKKGDLLLAIDPAPFENALNVQRIAVERARAAGRKGEALVNNTLVQREAQVAEARRRIELAKLELTEFQAGTRPLQLKVYEQELKQAKRALEGHKARAESGKTDGTLVDEAKVTLELAETKLEVFEKFTAPKMLRERESAVGTAERSAQQMRSQTEADLKAAQASLAAQQAQVDFELNRLKRLQNGLAKCRIIAPHDGVVAAAGRLPLRAGSQVRERQVVLILVPAEQ